MCFCNKINCTSNLCRWPLATLTDVARDAQLTQEEAAAFDKDPPKLQGYAGKAKGAMQLAWETGWYRPGMKKKMLQEVISKRSDFVAESSALSLTFITVGQGFVLSTKCHPEMAGKVVCMCVLLSLKLTIRART